MDSNRSRQPAPPSQRLIEQLRSAVGPGGLLTDPVAMLPYETDAMPVYRGRPCLVLLPSDELRLLSALRVLHEAGVPWVARGAGTGLSGGAVPTPGRGTAVVSLARLRGILEIRAAEGRARVEPGVVTDDLQRALLPHGLRFAPDPASSMTATLGGNIAENAGGPRALKYGVTGHHLLSARIVLGDGVVVRLGGEEESPPGYDLLSFFVGSEGTLGCLLEATVRAVPQPEAVRTFLAVFPTLAGASAAVGGVLRAGVIPAALEMIDAVVLEALSSDFALDLPAGGALVIGECDGLVETVTAETATLIEIFKSHGAVQVRAVDAEAERARLWAARRATFGALGRVAPSYLQHDAAVPRSALPDVLAQIERVAERTGLRIANVFHAGDGNLHPTILFDDQDELQCAQARSAAREIARLCIEAGGVLSGEHGVGLAKRDEMPWVFGDAELRLMDRLRRAFDSTGLVNPGKLLPGPYAAAASDGDADEEGVGPVRVAGSLVASEEVEPPPLVTGAGDGLYVAGRELSRPELRTAEAIAAALQARTFLTPVGGETMIACPVERNGGETPVRLMETWGFDRILRFDPEDFAMTVEAGVTLAQANQAAAEQGQQLIWEAPDPEQATLGGIVAAGHWSSLTTGHGHPKHSLLGFRAITGEGRLIAFGGRVVKNVTGYDVGKLMVGSRGTLAILTQLVLRTYPLPARRAMVTVDGEFGPLLGLALALRRRPLGWSLIDLFSDASTTRLLVGLDGYESEIRRRRAELERIVREGAGPAPSLGDLRIREGSEAPAIHRQAIDALAWSRSPLIVRIVVPPASMAVVAARVADLCRAGMGTSWRCRIHCLPAVGLLRILFDGDYEDVPLRRLFLDVATVVREAGGHRAIDRAPEHPWWGWDAWGVPAPLRERMRRVQAALDPKGALPAWVTA